MANGTLIPSMGTWKGTVTVQNAHAEGTFEIFLSGGAWEMLFSKPMLHTFKGIYNYETDEVTLKSNDASVVLLNANLVCSIPNAKRL